MRKNAFLMMTIGILLISFSACVPPTDAGTPPSGDTVAATLKADGLDGVWYFTGGVKPASWNVSWDFPDWPDTRLVIEATAQTYTYFWRDTSSTTIYNWTTDVSSESGTITSVGQGAMQSIVTVAPGSGSENEDVNVGDIRNTYYKIVGDELRWTWESADYIATDWTFYAIYKRTKPVAP